MATGDLTTLASVKAWLFGTNQAGFAATQKPIQAITQAANAQVTCNGHGFAQGQAVLLSNLGGMTPLSGQTVTVTVLDANNFTIGVNTSAYPAYAGGGVASAEDVVLARLVSAASAFVGSWLGRSIAQQGYSELWDGNGRVKMMFPNWPVSAVTSLAIDGMAIPPAPPSAPSGASLPGYLVTDRGMALALIGYSFTEGFQNVAVGYTAGYAATPPEIEQAVIELVALRYRERERVGEVSKSAGGQMTVSYSQQDMADGTKAALEPYRKVHPA
jgi:hypothetical protein